MQQEYLRKIKEGAIRSWLVHKILPSITGAQAILESGWGSSKLSKPPYNNNFGIKAEGGWTGRKVMMPTREVINGSSVMVNAYFRAYDSLADSVADHGAFFSSTPWRKENYKAIPGEKDYRKAAWALQRAGYATDPNYANALIRIIEQNSLRTWDEEAFRREANQNSTTDKEESNDTIPNTGEGGSGVDNPESTHADREFRRELAKKATAPVSKRVGRAMTNAGESHFKGVKVAFYADMTVHTSVAELRKMNPNLTAHLFNTLDDLSRIISGHQPPDTVIIACGAKGTFTETKLEEIIGKLGKRNVILVTLGSELPSRNAVEIVTKDLSNRLPNVYVADWLGYSRQRLPQFYNADPTTGYYINLSDHGGRKYAEFLAQSVYQVDLGTKFVGNYEPIILEDDREGIEEFELKPDGTVIHHTKDADGKEITQTHSTDLRGFVSPLGDSAIYATDSNAIWGNNDGVVLSEWIDGVYEADLAGLGLLLSAGKELEQRSQVSAQYRVNLLELPSDIRIGDVGQFIDHEFNPPLYIEARVISVKYDVFDHSVNEVVLGNVKELVPDYNPEVARLQNQLKSVRQEVLKDFKKGLPLEISIESTNGFIFYPDMEQTQLIAKVRQSGRDMTDQYVSFKWERILVHNNESAENRKFNEMLAQTESSSVLNVNRGDLGTESGTAVFVVYVFDENDNLIDTASVAVGTSKGKDGKDGRTSYTHVAYANSADGSVEFSISDPRGRAYMGVYTDHNPADSQDYTRYKWVLVKGEKGEKGEKGNQGAKGDPGDQSKNYFIAHNLEEVSTETTIGGVTYKRVQFDVPKNMRYTIVSTLPKDKREMFLLNTSNVVREDRRLTRTASEGHMVFLYLPEIEEKLMAMEPDYRVHIHKYTNMRLQWEPSTEDAIFINTRDMRNDLANKANAGLTQRQLNELKHQAEILLQEQQALASKRELNDFMQAFKSFISAQDQDKAEAEKNLSSALGRVAEIENVLGPMAVSWKFLTKEISASEEGLLIGNKSKGTYLLQSDDRISFFNNGSEVAFISGGMLRITRAVFLREIMIGAFSISEYENDHLTYRYVGRR